MKRDIETYQRNFAKCRKIRDRRNRRSNRRGNTVLIERLLPIVTIINVVAD